MKKKLWIVLGASVMVLALGTGVYAATDENTEFKELLPFMKQMHPEATDQQLEEMYNNCHSENSPMSGMMRNSSGMMGNSPTIVQ